MNKWLPSNFRHHSWAFAKDVKAKFQFWIPFLLLFFNAQISPFISRTGLNSFHQVSSQIKTSKDICYLCFEPRGQLLFPQLVGNLQRFASKLLENSENLSKIRFFVVIVPSVGAFSHIFHSSSISTHQSTFGYDWVCKATCRDFKKGKMFGSSRKLLKFCFVFREAWKLSWVKWNVSQIKLTFRRIVFVQTWKHQRIFFLFEKNEQ